MKKTKVFITLAGYAITALFHRFLYDGSLEQFIGFTLIHGLWTAVVLEWCGIEVYTD
jgi:hypothetical protein